MTFPVIQMRCQRFSPVIHQRWSCLGEFVLIAGLPDDSRPSCWPCKCRPPFSGIYVSSFKPPSLEISSSSHHSWRLFLLFMPLPLPWAASFWQCGIDSAAASVYLIASWCDKCGIVRELKEGCEVLLVWERVCLGRSTSKGECLRDLLAGPSWEGFDVRTLVVLFSVHH